jgi:DNA-binding NtrC family response regulator
MKTKGRIIVIDDELTMLRVIKKTLGNEGYHVETFNSAFDALSRLKEDSFDILITDLMMPEMDGFRVLEVVKDAYSDIIVIVITAYSSIETAIKAMKLGAYDFIPKPFDPEHLLMIINRALENRFLRLENVDLKRRLDERDYMEEIKGVSLAISAVKEMIKKVRNTDVNVLISGESGTGKELVAKAIHYGSRRRKMPFLPINCAALPDDLLESELFGYERGAFTGAYSSKEGLFELAHGGTVFLDEIESISPMMQAKLLRFLQDRTFFRLGGKSPRQVDIRVISATNEDLLEAIKEGRFRKDLYYRLNVIPINIPPLRERREDIPLLIRYFIERFSKRHSKVPVSISKEAEKVLTKYPWEGNVRELENTIERIITLRDNSGDCINLEDIPEEIRSYEEGKEDDKAGYSPYMTLSEVEKRHIERVLAFTGGNKSRAAKILGIDYSTLLRKLRAMDA